MKRLLPSPLPDLLGDTSLHGDVELVDAASLAFATPRAQWAYAVSWAVRDPQTDADAAIDRRLIVNLTVRSGAVGVGWLNLAGDAFLTEKTCADVDGRVVLTVPAPGAAGRLVIRNVSAAGASAFALRGVHLDAVSSGGIRDQVAVARRSFRTEPPPDDGGSEIVFDTEAARAINLARLGWLAAVGIAQAGDRVIDVGSGVGHFLPFYLEQGCSVVAVDGRADNIAALRRRHPDVDAHVGDIQTMAADSLGTFDLVHCFGLLYHLDSPIAALRTLHAICRRSLVLETMVCDSKQPIVSLADESKAASQALDGLGSRPSPSFIALALDRIGFEYIYGAVEPPRHPDFQFVWRNDMATARDGHPLRSVFVASHVRIDHPLLVSLID